MGGCPPSGVPRSLNLLNAGGPITNVPCVSSSRFPPYPPTLPIAWTCAAERRRRRASSGRRADAHAWCGPAGIRWSSVSSPLRAGRRPSSCTTTSTCSPRPGEAEGWRTEPFRFVRRGDRYFGRGTTDDKGPALAALFGVRAAREAGVPIGVRLLWEMEEEIGSPSLEPVLRALRAEDGRTASWCRMRPGSTGGAPRRSPASAGSSRSASSSTPRRGTPTPATWVAPPAIPWPS